jgi:hypothetical protein
MLKKRESWLTDVCIVWRSLLLIPGTSCQKKKTQLECRGLHTKKITARMHANGVI